MNAKTQQKFHEFLTQRIDLCKYTQIEISKMMGYTKPNLISMFKQGLTKVPIEKIPVLARILNVDPAVMLRMAMTEYMPGTLHAVEECLGVVATESEKNLLKKIRDKIGEGANLDDPTYKAAVDQFIASL